MKAIILVVNENQNGNVQTMTSLEIAELTGKQHKNIMQAIRNMEPAWEKVQGLKFQLSSRTYQLPNGGTKEVPCYVLTKTECLYIATANYTTNNLSTSQWATLEKQGCVFLPAAGGRAGTNVVNVGSIGDYWSSDASGETNAYDLNFSNNHLLPQNTAGQRHYGWSVRLVRDVE